MQEELFRRGLCNWGYTDEAIRTRISKCRRVEEFEGNLDEHYDRDRCEALLVRLTYTMDDFRANRATVHSIPIDGNRYDGTQSLKGAVAKYVEVRDAAAGIDTIQVPSRGAGNQMRGRRRSAARFAQAPNRNSYDELFEVFPDIADRLCQFGLENSVYAANGTPENDELVLRQWHDVVAALEGNDNIYIRLKDTNSQEFRFYRNLYADPRLFGNNRLNAGGDGNYYAKRAIQNVTGWNVKQNPRRGMDRGCLVYFTVSHVFGNRTKNPLLFTAAWNIVLTPNLIDPFTNEENHYEFAERFKEEFRARIRESEVVRRCINEYNAFIDRHDVHEFIRNFAPGGFTPEELLRLRDAALRNWEPIPLDR